MPIVPRKARTLARVRASWPVLEGVNPHRAMVPEPRPKPKRVAHPQCGHTLPVEAQALYAVWEPADGITYPEWYCPTCKAWRLVNIYPDLTEAPLLF